MFVLLKTDSYTGRRKTKNKWSYKNYTVLHQLGPDIPTYEIQAEGGSTRIVHWNQLFLLLPKKEDDNCVPLVTALQAEIMDSPWTVTRIHSLRGGLSPQGKCENVRGSRYAWSWVHLPTDPARPGDSQIT